MEWNQFSSFVTSSEEEAMVETWNGEIVRLGAFVSGGSGSGSGSEGEGKNEYKVCTEIEITEKLGRVKVVVVDGEEENGGENCLVGMEGGEVEVEGEIGKGEVNGEGVVVDMGSGLRRVLLECEDIQIVLNVTYGGSNG